MAPKPSSVKDIPAQTFVKAYAAHLKREGKLVLPAWVDLVKTSSAHELAPYDADWFYVRAAALARRVYLRQGTGVGAFRKVYGGNKNNGSCPSHFRAASGSVIRNALQQLEALGVVEKLPTGGRRITSAGQRALDQVASQVRVKA
eukprot:TRINITY_DN16185_c0_g1_i1.p3 TRINITY_DN16185_c0_g1~~TRINITY_DN16185_c0_g1_i1.p3  ORF type:complete len:145 (-),score=23.43 TRINITY_DN16185_c0_g1_i1:37-471(-)